MKILVATLPQQAQPTTFPPIGALSVINYVRKNAAADVQIEFLNLDAHRPAFVDALARIECYRPDVIGLSAVVSTAYAYTKELSLAIKRVLPDTLVVVGGNMGASAEILLRKTGVDICVLGEGERVFLNLINQIKVDRRPSALKLIRGLAYLDEDDKLVNTGYEDPLPAEEIWDVDWADVERDGSLDLYFPVIAQGDFTGKLTSETDDRLAESSGAKKRYGSLTCAKGCVSRCTFCHRWDKGIRHIPVDIVLKRLDQLIEKYNVGALDMVAESFGSDKRWLTTLLEKIRPYHIPWKAAGVRTSVVTPELIEQMKASGCYFIIYGNETGSSSMLEVMEKKVTLADNHNAARWTAEAGLSNVIQLVIGMPGESPETIRETIEYVKFATTLSPDQDPRQVSINYAQALPGTPLYEFGRSAGLIGRDLDSEEAYLLSISDRDASDPLTFLNFTNHSRLTVLSWHLLIRIETRFHYVTVFGASHYYKLLLSDNSVSGLPELAIQSLKSSGRPTAGLFLKLLARGRFSALMACYPWLFYRLRRFAGLFTLANILKEYGAGPAWHICKDYVRYLLRIAGQPWHFRYRSLRKIVEHEIDPVAGDSPEMAPLRKGR